MWHVIASIFLTTKKHKANPIELTPNENPALYQLTTNKKRTLLCVKSSFKLFVTPAGFKPATFWSVVRCSIQLSYGAKPYCFVEALFLKSECKGIAFYLNLQTFKLLFSKKVILFLFSHYFRPIFGLNSGISIGVQPFCAESRDNSVRHDHSAASYTSMSSGSPLLRQCIRRASIA